MYAYPTVADPEIPRASTPLLQHVLDTYASEINKTSCVWSAFAGVDLNYRPHPRSSTVAENLRHELLSGRRFFGEFLGVPEPPADQILPPVISVDSCSKRLIEHAKPRLPFMAAQPESWWLEYRPFFDVTRPRIWIFWRRILHSAHHRTQLGGYLRLLERPVPAMYGPTADVTWSGADPTRSVDAAARR